jgi:hypothetical protein
MSLSASATTEEIVGQLSDVVQRQQEINEVRMRCFSVMMISCD